jgi:phage I-like protein
VPKRSSAARTLTRIGLSIAVDGDALPSEFRLFKAGENLTTKGVFLFDAKAADLVMAAWKAYGNDLAIDLEHLALDPDARAYDPDARGWFKLAVRDGELWAVDVKWAPDGARRLSEKTQRYISPAFCTDDDNRVIEIVNVALVAMPATHSTPALVAAHRGTRMSVKEAARALAPVLSAKLSIARAQLVKLADGEGDAPPPGKAASVKAAGEKAAEMIAALIESFDGSDIDATFAAMGAATAATDEFKSKVDAMMGAAPAPAPEAEAMSEEKPAEETEKMARAMAELATLRREKAEAAEAAKITALAAEMTERAELEGKLVKLGRETPHTVKALAALSLADLRARVTAFEALPSALRHPPQSPTGGGSVTASGGVEISEYEAARVKLYADRLKAVHGGNARQADEVVGRYVAHKGQQHKGAKTHELAKRYGRRVEQDDVLVSLASTPVRPFEELGPSTQRALEEFRMNYNMALAAEPKVWAEQIGDVLTGGSLKDTYPLNFSSTRYVEKTAQSAGAETPNNVDISITKREFAAAEQADMRRLQAGDFAYVLWWGRQAERMARQRVFVRNRIVTTLLEAGESGYWGYDASLYPTGIDGLPYFSASHKVNPFNAAMKLRGVATWGNLETSATVLTAVNLTAQKSKAFLVAGPDGNELGYEYDGVLVPSSLTETARNLLTVQELILEAGTVNGVANSFGATRNPHHLSGMTVERAPELAGTDTTADWYLISRSAIAAGLFPWVIAEDGAEDLRTWDENSDFAKDSGFIKVASHIFINAALLFPHAIRKVSGT